MPQPNPQDGNAYGSAQQALGVIVGMAYGYDWEAFLAVAEAAAEKYGREDAPPEWRGTVHEWKVARHNITVVVQHAKAVQQMVQATRAYRVMGPDGQLAPHLPPHGEASHG